MFGFFRQRPLATAGAITSAAVINYLAVADVANAERIARECVGECVNLPPHTMDLNDPNDPMIQLLTYMSQMSCKLARMLIEQCADGMPTSCETLAGIPAKALARCGLQG